MSRYVNSAVTRRESTNCGGIQYEPQSVEAERLPEVNDPADGKIASAAIVFSGGARLNRQRIAGLNVLSN
ncbi:hypothetical protein O9992_26185 [Vibrio lentus]|nr:hypothetical protein [Vibrio lentus]